MCRDPIMCKAHRETGELLEREPWSPSYERGSQVATGQVVYLDGKEIAT